MSAPLLLFDGDCAFCARSVRFLLEHDRRLRTARVAPRLGVAGRAVLAAHPELAGVESLVWVETEDGVERAHVRSGALLRIARYLGGGWAVLAAVAAVIPRPLRDLGYAAIAATRKRLLPGAPACLVPAPEHAGRVLD